MENAHQPSKDLSCQPATAGFFRCNALVFTIAIICLASSSLTYQSFKYAATSNQLSRTEHHAEEHHFEIVDAFNSYTQALMLTRGFIHASNNVSHDEWKRFISSANLEAHYPGVWGFGYVQRVEPDNVNDFLAGLHEQDNEHFKIITHKDIDKSDSNDPLYIVKYEEPESRNKNAIGLNAAANPVNREVYDRATDTGMVQISSPFQLKQQEGTDSKIGLVMALPHFDYSTPTNTIEQRQKAVLGWVIVVLDMDYLAADFVDNNTDLSHVIVTTQSLSNNEITLFDTNNFNTNRSSPIHNANLFDQSYDYSFGGRNFANYVTIDLDLQASPALIHTSLGSLDKADVALLIGVIVSFLITALAWTITTGRSRAVKLATQMTSSLRQSEQSQRALAKQAMSASEAKSMFLANMSHEIRTPMTTILGYTDLLSELIPLHKNPELMRSAVQRVKVSGARLLDIINDILDHSRIESGNLDINVSACKVAEVFTEVMGIMGPSAENKSITLSTQFNTPIPATIITDSYRLKQLVTNLVDNAIKFTDQGKITIELEADQSSFTIAVHDTGQGIDPEQLQEMFKPFEQADGSMMRAQQGTGLGLSISQKIAELMHGSLTAKSTLGHGSVFTLKIPLVTPDNTDTEILTELPKPESLKGKMRHSDIAIKGRILVAEDGPDNQRLLKHFLSKAGMEVVIVDNGQLALDHLSTDENFHLIIMDMQMPVLDGYQATKKLRQLGCKIPILALTAHALPNDRQLCLDAGCDEYETKPFNRTRLLRTVERLINAKTKNIYRAA